MIFQAKTQAEIFLLNRPQGGSDDHEEEDEIRDLTNARPTNSSNLESIGNYSTASLNSKKQVLHLWTQWLYRVTQSVQDCIFCWLWFEISEMLSQAIPIRSDLGMLR